MYNANRGETERIAQVFEIQGKEQSAAPELAAGDIGAVTKLSAALTGDTLCSSEQPIILDGLDFPAAVYLRAVYPKSKADVDKMTSSLSRIVEEDPSIVTSREPDTNEMLIAGLGDTHLGVTIEKMQRKFGAEMILEIPMVPYKETINSRARVEYRHKKQTGGHGQFGHVWIEVEPMPRGTGFEFSETIVGGVVPREYIPSVEKGVRNALSGGVVAGYPVVDMKATLVDGSFHPVDSSGVSFEIAGGQAATKGIQQATPIILEPIMKVEITVPGQLHRRHHWRPQQSARQDTGHDPWRWHDHPAGRSPAGRNAYLRDRTSQPDTGPGRLHHGIRPLRRSPNPHGGPRRPDHPGNTRKRRRRAPRTTPVELIKQMAAARLNRCGHLCICKCVG